MLSESLFSLQKPLVYMILNSAFNNISVYLQTSPVEILVILYFLSDDIANIYI